MCKENFINSVVVTGGGTGGHYFPAIAIANSISSLWPVTKVIFIGSKNGIENRLSKKSTLLHILLDTNGFVGKSLLRSLISLYKLHKAWKSLVNLWQCNRPYVVIGTGGYSSGPALLAAYTLKIPFFLHESNAKPGLLVKYLAHASEGVWCGMSDAISYLPNARCIFAGTPVRSMFLRRFVGMSLHYNKIRRRLLVLGGSGGSTVINDSILSIASIILDMFPNWEIVHQTGYKNFSKYYGMNIHIRHHIVPFIANIDREMESASLVITRSGASTCSELRICGRPALLIPMLKSAGNHQVLNAEAMVRDGRAVLLREDDFLFRDNLLGKLSYLMSSDELLFDMSRPERSKAIQKCLSDLILQLVKNNSHNI